MKEVLKKLLEARLAIYNSGLKKAGRNDYSNYDYFTPEQVERLVDNACSKTNTIILCNLKADEYGLFQTLDFIDLDTEQKLSFEMRTKHGSITATNETQQMGGTDTYSERYIKMKVFQIKDNNLDFDSMDNRQTVKTSAGNTYNNPIPPQIKKVFPDATPVVATTPSPVATGATPVNPVVEEVASSVNPVINKLKNYKKPADNDDMAWIKDDVFYNEVKTMQQDGTITKETTPPEVLKLLRNKYKVAQRYLDLVPLAMDNQPVENPISKDVEPPTEFLKD